MKGIPISNVFEPLNNSGIISVLISLNLWHKFSIINALEWNLVHETQECGGTEISKGNKDSIDECAKACNGVASMFVLGTNDFGAQRCHAD